MPAACACGNLLRYHPVNEYGGKCCHCGQVLSDHAPKLRYTPAERVVLAHHYCPTEESTVNNIIPPARHLCGHLPLEQTAETPNTFCAKCAAWGCTTVNCPGHMRWPEATTKDES